MGWFSRIWKNPFARMVIDEATRRLADSADEAANVAWQYGKALAKDGVSPEERVRIRAAIDAFNKELTK